MRAEWALLSVVVASSAFLACGPKEDDTKTTTVPQTGAPMPEIRGTSFEADLKGLGLDPAKLPKFADLTKEQKKGLMPFFAKSLGIPCSGCHAGAAETPNMRAAKKMWDQWVVGFTVTGGHPGLAFCDSCHQGKKEFLDRSNHDAIAGWMKTNFVDHHVSGSAPGTGCARCHGEPFQAKFVADWKK